MKRAYRSAIRLAVVASCFAAPQGRTAFAQINLPPPVSYPVPRSPAALIAVDLNGDMAIDLATFDQGTGTTPDRLSVLINNGDGTFAAAMNQIIPSIGQGVRAFTAGDLNGNGDPDLIVARPGPFPDGNGILSVFLNNGDGSFGTPIDYPIIVTNVPNQQLTPMSLIAADLDGDQDVDIAAAAVMLNLLGQPGFFVVMFNDGVDGFGHPILRTSVNIDSTQSFSKAITADDFDNDLDIDLAVASRLDNSVSVFLNDGDGVTGSVRNEKLGGNVASPGRIIAGDLNGTGFVDLLTINAFHTYSIVLNLDGGNDPNKAGSFKDQGQFPLGDQSLPAGNIPSGAALADLDGDGDLDLAAGLIGDSFSGGLGSLAVLPNSGTGTLGPEINIGDCVNFGAIVAGDLDNDGDIDIASTNAGLNVVQVVINQQIPSAEPPPDITDTDGDGVPNCTDGCPTDPNKFQPEQCGCGVPETDSDGDGAADCIDGCANDPNKFAPGVCGCNTPDADSDGDGVIDCEDGCPNDANKTAPGECGCGRPDTDTDGDGQADCNAAVPTVSQWGLVVMALLLVTVATAVCRNQFQPLPNR